MKETESLTAIKVKLTEENAKLKRDVSLQQQSVQEYSKHSYRQSKEIKDLTTKVRGLERSLSQVVHDFEREKDRVIDKHKQDSEDMELENNGLRRVLQTKEREAKQIKKLASDILSQRSEVEQFFLDSLDEVKENIRKQREADRGRGGFFLTQANDYGIRSGLSFPQIGPGVTPGTGTDTRRAQSDRVDVRDLPWEDKERVLRLLFAKINQAQVKRAQVAKPGSAREGGGLSRGFDQGRLHQSRGKSGRWL